MKKIRSFSEKNIERFSRQILIDEIGPKGQLNIMNSSIIVIGCGGLGTAAISYLSMLGIGRISIVDNDIVSLSNLNRQSLFSEGDIGEKKVKVAKKRIISINSEIDVQISTRRVRKENIKELIKNYEIVLDCTDNFKSRYIINDECFKQRKILISAALYSFEVQLFAFKAWSGKNNPCYRCIFPEQKKLTTLGNCNDYGIISPVAGLGGILQTNYVVNAILKKNSLMYRQLLIYNCLNANQSKINYQKDKECKICKNT